MRHSPRRKYRAPARDVSAIANPLDDLLRRDRSWSALNDNTPRIERLARAALPYGALSLIAERSETPSFLPRQAPSLQRVTWSQVQDNRQWHPGYNHPALLSGGPVNLGTYHNPYQVKSSELNRALVCLRRKVRREIMHAMGIAGSHVRKGENPPDNIRC